MYFELYIAGGALLILVASFVMYQSKAKFQNITAARLVLLRSCFALVYVTLIYYFVFIWESFSLQYLLVLLGAAIIFILFDRQIKKTQSPSK